MAQDSGRQHKGGEERAAADYEFLPKPLILRKFLARQPEKRDRATSEAEAHSFKVDL